MRPSVSESRITDILKVFGFHYDPGAPSHREKMERALKLPAPKFRTSRAKTGSVPFVVFLINYIREQFDTNDEGSRVAYFELLADISDDEVREIIQLYSMRSRWVGYPDFPEQLNAAREELGSKPRRAAPKRVTLGRFDGLFSWRMYELPQPKNNMTGKRLAESLRVESLPYEKVPPYMYKSVVAFRHLRSDARERAADDYLIRTNQA